MKTDLTDRWNRWVNRNFGRLTKLVVHPDDWMDVGCPTHSRGIPIKPLGIE